MVAVAVIIATAAICWDAAVNSRVCSSWPNNTQTHNLHLLEMCSESAHRSCTRHTVAIDSSEETNRSANNQLVGLPVTQNLTVV